MQRIAFLMKVKPGHEEEYRQRHQAVYPELLAALRGAGVSNYSIYLQGQQLFAYMEVRDFAEMTRIMAADPANQRWQEFMAPIMQIELDPATNHPAALEEVFHLD